MVSVQKLRRFWLAALVIGAFSFVLGLLWTASPGGPGLDWIWAVAAFGLGAIVYNLAFFLLCTVFASGLSSHVEDDTEVHGDDVVHVVRHKVSGDETLDFYIRAYASARAITAVTIVSVTLGGLAIVFF